MDFDEQLRSAHQRRLASTRHRLADREFEPVQLDSDESVANRPKLSTRVLAVAAGLLVVVGGAWAVSGPITGEPTVEFEVGSGDGSAGGDSSSLEDQQAENSDSEATSGSDGSAGGDQQETLVVAEPEEDPTDTSDIEDTDAGSDIESDIENTDRVDDESTPDTTADQLSSTTEDPSEVSTPSTTLGSSDTTDVDDPPVEFDQGVPVETSICASGRRAPLERASLQYVGATNGWMRMINLVDEQDGPFYFKGWEPGFGQSVTVKLVLEKPVLASEIKLAQDPDNEVSGLIAIGVPGGGFNIELDGIGGWKSHQFDVPIALDSFTINRQSAESNVMEVIVCVVAE